MLRRQISEVEERTREKLREEKKKHQEVVKKVERERRIVLDNYETRSETRLQPKVFSLVNLNFFPTQGFELNVVGVIVRVGGRDLALEKPTHQILASCTELFEKFEVVETILYCSA